MSSVFSYGFSFLLAILLSVPAYGQEIVVEASRLRAEAPAARSVIHEKEVATQPSVADALRQTSGVDVIRQGAVGQTSSVFIRGARSEDTLVLIDGVEANDIMSPSAGFDFANLMGHNIERIEIFRGPQTVRFGPGALGGVINIITKEGHGPNHINYSVEGGSFDTAHVNLLSSGGDKLGYSLGVDGFQTHGFSAADKLYGNAEPDGAQTGTLSSKISWLPGALTNLTTTFRYMRNRADLDRSGGPGGDDPNNSSLFKQTLIGIKGEHRFGAIKSDLGLFFSEAERSNSNPRDTSSSDDSTDYFISEHFRTSTRHEYTIDDFHSVALGLEWRLETGLSHSVFNNAVTDISRQNQTLGSESITYNYTGHRWFAEAGLRSDQKSSGGSSPSGRALVGRKFGLTTSAQLSFGTGVKSPSLYQLFSAYGNSALRSELADTAEFQVDQTITDLSAASFAVFSNHFRDLISFDSITNKYFNISNAETSGAEFQIRTQLNSEWSVNGRYTYLNTKDLSTGLKLIRRPQDAWGYSLHFEKSGFEMNLTSRFIGARDDVDPVSFSRVTNPAYTVVDILGSYKMKVDTKFVWRIENIQNQAYQEVYGYGVAGLSFYAGFTGEI